MAVFDFLRQVPELVDDPVFGKLSRRRGWFGGSRVWTGTAKTDLFPGRELLLDVEATAEDEFAAHRKHFKLLLANSPTVRKDIEQSVWDYYQVYRDAEPQLAYRDLAAPEDIWNLLAPRLWFFPRRQPNQDFDSVIGLEIDWPNPHDLVAYFDEDNLHTVQIEG